MSVCVSDIVGDWLKKRGYDALYNDCGCGCPLDDMFDCPMITAGSCIPAYQFRCEECSRDDCESRDEQECIIFSPDKDFCKPIYDALNSDDSSNDKGAHE